MTQRIPLPHHLHRAAFRTSDVAPHEVGVGRLRGRDVQHPFHAVRSVGLDLDGVLDRCRAYEPLLGRKHYFSHVTAAALFGMPVGFRSRSALHVATLEGRTPARSRGVIGHVVKAAGVSVTLVHGLPAIAPSDVWCQLAATFSNADLVAVGDFLITGRRIGPGRRAAALCTIEELDAAVIRHRGCRGATALRWALPRLRAGADSAPESHLRLLCIAAGLPEPVIGAEVPVADGLRLHPDLAYPDLKIAIEYEGEGHRTDAAQFRRDIERKELYEDVEWRVMRVSADHLYRDPDALVRRIRLKIAKQRDHLAGESSQTAVSSRMNRRS